MTIVSDNTTLGECAGQAPSSAACGAPQRHFVADLSERLMAEFGARIDLSVISRTVLDCHNDLQSLPSGATPELVEAQARERLLLAEPSQRSAVIASDSRGAPIRRAPVRD